MAEKASTIKFQNWSQLLSFGMGMENWFFRGQARSSWSLSSSLEREISIKAGSSTNWEYVEKWMFQKFCGFAHNYLPHIPEKDDLLEWLALMQHYGAPTRLLDFTRSLPVAAYFAARDADADFAIWALNWNQFFKSIEKRFELSFQSSVAVNLQFHHAMHEKANEFLSKKASGALVFPVQPRRSNERLETQQGLFLFPTDPARSMLKNIECLIGEDIIRSLNEKSNEQPFDSTKHGSMQLKEQWVIKCVLSHAERIQTLIDLQRMNIHEASLFPGLDGFARSLRVYTLRHR